MPLISIASVVVPAWQRDSDVELRVYALQSFVASPTNTVVPAGCPSEDESQSDNNYWSAPVTVDPVAKTATVAAISLFSTTDSDNPQARYAAYFYTTEGERICPFAEFANFSLPGDFTSTTWKDIAAAQGANI